MIGDDDAGAALNAQTTTRTNHPGWALRFHRKKSMTLERWPFSQIMTGQPRPRQVYGL
jgi:hypothetical protein